MMNTQLNEISYDEMRELRMDFTKPEIVAILVKEYGYSKADARFIVGISSDLID